MTSRGRKHRNEGAAAVEFALVLLPLLAIVAGIIDFGLMLNAQLSLTHAAREGVRVLAIGDGDGAAAATTAFQPSPGATGFAATPTGCPNAAGRAVMQTSATYEYYFLRVFLPEDGRPLQSRAVMRCNG
ncbi:TadE/TadG family type IV pilus assembly protein [Egicoccus sp. AB-alg2]|uniref:TadE/TadG family type IV pilus assembly protein n=1 Tax=Egicoccus sp. AB-alg2 TaxID=3242693 RepID=UPI00359E8254